MDQLPLSFEPVRSRRADPATSQVSADLVREFEGEHFAKILKSLRFEGPQTIHELAVATGMTAVQIARRLPELEDAARVQVRKGVTRNSPAGRPCRVWELAP